MPFAQTASLRKIIDVLAEEPNGLWVREIARRTKLKSATVTYFVNRHPEIFDDQAVESGGKKLFRLVKLKRTALTRHGIALSRILREYEKR